LIELKNLVKISKIVGERFDLVQAAGGNSSVKIKNNEMLIKASGFLLSDMTINNGFSKVNTKKISNILKNKSIINETNKKKREHLVKKLLEKATIHKKNRPSIETLIHSSLYKYTLHTHPIVVNMIVIQKKWKEILLSIFKKENIALIPYKTPGIELALELNRAVNTSKNISKIYFLQNHGLIISSNNNLEILKLTEFVLNKLEKFLDVNMYRYKLTNKISKLINNVKKNTNVIYLSEDKYLNEKIIQNKKLFMQTPFCPDSLVFCGISAIFLNNLTDAKILKNYMKTYRDLPKVIIFRQYIFFNAISIKKAREMEEIMKFHIMVLEKNLNTNINFLEPKELSYLSNWEAENFRKKI